ncbi:two-component sensor histidine kinase [Calothrix sp. HK-06]|nr:two-component sensor histidine kinase [Calothrix sp. HK-06]
MESNPLFRLTRLRLAAWYALVMGGILGISSLGIYQVVAHAYRETIDQGLQSVASTLHKSIEPAWQQPKQLQQLAKELSFEICINSTNCWGKKRIIQQPIAKTADSVNYYMRLLDRNERLIAETGLDKILTVSLSERWQNLIDSDGIRYRQISLPLHTQNKISGYMQVGRSLNDLDQRLTFLRLTLLLGLPIEIIFVGLSSWWLAGKAMQPVYLSYQQMQQFTADAAHEFRTPLAAMHSTIEAAIRLHGETSSGQGILDVLKRQNRRLSQLVADLLLLTRIDYKQQREEDYRCCLNDLISDLVEELAFLAIETEITISKQIITKEKIYVLGNEEQLYRLIYNLMVNAIQASNNGGKVTVSLERNERYAFIKIQDNGIGIAPEHQKRIFDRFYRVEHDRSRITGGSGLGLAIAIAIATAHKGSIQVQSKPKLETIFTVQLPVS